jgi:hypothetical protein
MQFKKYYYIMKNGGEEEFLGSQSKMAKLSLKFSLYLHFLNVVRLW